MGALANPAGWAPAHFPEARLCALETELAKATTEQHESLGAKLGRESDSGQQAASKILLRGGGVRRHPLEKPIALPVFFFWRKCYCLRTEFQNGVRTSNTEFPNLEFEDEFQVSHRERGAKLTKRTSLLRCVSCFRKLKRSARSEFFWVRRKRSLEEEVEGKALQERHEEQEESKNDDDGGDGASGNDKEGGRQDGAGVFEEIQTLADLAGGS